MRNWCAHSRSLCPAPNLHPREMSNRGHFLSLKPPGRLSKCNSELHCGQSHSPIASVCSTADQGRKKGVRSSDPGPHPFKPHSCFAPTLQRPSQHRHPPCRSPCNGLGRAMACRRTSPQRRVTGGSQGCLKSVVYSQHQPPKSMGSPQANGRELFLEASGEACAGTRFVFLWFAFPIPAPNAVLHASMKSFSEHLCPFPMLSVPTEGERTRDAP